MKIAIYGSRHQQAYVSEIQSLLRRLVLSGHEVMLATKLYTHLQDLGVALSGIGCAGDSLPEGTGMAISIGGDGTFLRTASWVGESEVPVLGVNTGHLGYLAGVSLEELLGNIDRFIVAEPDTESRTLIEVVSPPVKGWRYALNEVTIAKEESASMVSAMTYIDGRRLAEYRADGLIVSTPTGSTAYNLSVGGPIVEPSAPVFVISPIAAHSLSLRPMVVNDRSVLDIRVEGRAHSFRLTVDGRSTTLPMGSEVCLRRAPFVTKIVRCEATDFPEPLRRKLMFN